MALSVITPVSKSARIKIAVVSEGTAVEMFGLRKGAYILGFQVHTAAGSTDGTVDIGVKGGSGDEYVDGLDTSTSTNGLQGINLLDQSGEDQIVTATVVGTGAGPFLVAMHYID